MNGELWGVGRTFILAALGLIFAFVLILTGKIPEVITLGEWTILIATVVGFFSAKSIGQKFAERKA